MKTHWKCRTGISQWAICFSLVGIWISTSSIWAQSVGGIPDAEQRMVWRMNPSIFQYEKSYNGITITGIEPWDEEDDVYQTIPYAVQVPDKIDGLPVTSIGRNAFANSYGMIRIVLPESITSIGNGAFAGCNCLTTFTIPKNVTTLGDGVFEQCTELRSVFIPQYVTSMNDDTWTSCTSLESIQVSSENSVYQSIDGVLFSKDGTTLLHYPAGRKEKTYTIPAGVTTINDEAFEGCGALTKVVLPESVTTIGKMAFYGCGSLADVTLPNSLTTIGNSAFYGCCLKSITLPNSLTTIGKMAFYGCSGLANITIPAGTTTLGDCLASCHTLRIEVSPDNPSYQSIDGVLFSKDGTTLLYYSADQKEKTYTIPAGVTTIGRMAFYGCSDLADVTIPESVTTIGKMAFYGCNGLANVTLPNSVTTIEEGLVHCKTLRSIEVSPDNPSYQSIDGVLYSKDGTTLCCYPMARGGDAYTLPEGVTTIGKMAFYGCSDLADITLPESLTTIGDEAFYGCIGLTDITLPESLTTIGDRAFYKCRGLVDVTLPNSVTTLGDQAFYGFSDLTTLAIPAGTTTLGDCLANCHTFRIEVSPDNPFYQSIDGVLFSKDGTTLIRYPSNRRKKSYTLPEGVTTIGDNAFVSSTSLKTLTLPEGVTTIGDHAFMWSNLKNITLPASVTTIGLDTFTACFDLQSIDVSPENTSYQSIDGVLFSKDGTTLLHYPASREGESYTFPEGVTTIRYHAFYESRRLRSLTLPETITTVEKLAFDRCKSLKTFVPNMAAMEEGRFEHLTRLERIQFPEGLTTIPNGSLARCQKLGSIQIPASVTTIGNRVFEDCGDLQYIEVSPDNSVYQSINGVLYSKDGTTLIRFPCLHSDPRPDEIPLSVTTIGERAFAGCRYLRSLAICPNVTTIGDGAFEDCPNLKLLRRNIPLQRNSFGDFAAIRREKSINPASDFEYQTHDGAITITKLKNLRMCGLVQIPDEIDGLPVTALGECAFVGCRDLNIITIPQSVTTIGNSVFACEKLNFIDISPDNPVYQSIDGVLLSKDGTTLIRYPAAHEGESYTIPKGVTTINSGAFAVCNNLTTLSIPESVTTIGDEAFVACGSLTTLTIPEGVTTIGDWVFAECYSLTTLSIPESVTSIGKECFARCKCLESINVSPENDVYRSMDGVLLSKDGTTLIRYPIGHKETSYTIPKGVTTIRTWAFADCEALTSLTFSDSVTTIDEMAFDRCTRLTTLSIPASVTNIGRNAFVHCERINTINVSPDNPSYKSIDGVLLSKDGTALCCYPAGREGESYTFPEGVTTIDCGAFEGNRFLVILTIPKSVTTLGCGVFMGCTNLTTLVIPDSVTTIGRNLRESYLALTIWTPRDSAAEKYAKENKIRFEPYPQPTT